jgi:hypothetical protein
LSNKASFLAAIDALQLDPGPSHQQLDEGFEYQPLLEVGIV